MTSSALQSQKWQLMVPQHIMWLSTAHANKLDPWCSQQTHHHPTQSHQASTPQPTTGELLLISHSTQGRRLSWPEHTVGQQLAQGCLQWTGCESNTVTSLILYHQTNCHRYTNVHQHTLGQLCHLLVWPKIPLSVGISDLHLRRYGTGTGRPVYITCAIRGGINMYISSIEIFLLAKTT